MLPNKIENKCQSIDSMSPASVCQGIAILSEIFETGNGSSVAIENIGLIALTRVGSRSMVQISAGFMLFFSVLGEIWSSLCLHSNAYRGCVVLPLLCLCWGSVGLVLAECSLGRPMLIHHALDEQHLFCFCFLCWKLKSREEFRGHKSNPRFKALCSSLLKTQT
ncbi:uncharacterized protein [Henckelia pumila]|uniref:uncharacterized protein isoform X2 n=1 Tax=Henckelia pumila TaxID=405737 RepID=UPI003C6E4B48